MRHFSNLGIYCIEGFWPSQRPSYSAIKQSLDSIQSMTSVRVIHRSPVTLTQFYKFLTEWASSEFLNYQILILSFHGSSGAIYIGEVNVSLEEIATWIEGSGHNRMMFFSSCQTLKIPLSRIKNFILKSSLRGVAGWVHSRYFH